MEQQNFWKKCSSCKNPINYSTKYYICSVSTCNGQRTGYVFCSVACFERHLPGARHKDAAAMEEMSPSKGAAGAAYASAPKPAGGGPAKTGIVSGGPLRDPATRTTLVRPAGVAGLAVTPPSSYKSTSMSAAAVERDILIIASRLKDYITVKADMNTSGSVMEVLSDHVRIITERAIENARADGRKTLMDRDFAFLKSMK